MASENSKSLEKEKKDFREYNEIVKNSVIFDIKLMKSSFELKAEFFDDDRPKKKFSFGFDLENFHYDDKKGTLIGEFSWYAIIKEGKKHLCAIKANYLVIYRTGKGYKSNIAKNFVSTVGKFTVFPYFRALVSHYSAASSADLPLLPVLKQRIDPS